MRVVREAGFDRVWVPPCASDTGAPLGSALWHQHQVLRVPRRQPMSHAYLGLEFDRRAIVSALETAGLDFEELDEDALLTRVADDLASGRIVGWLQGRYEIGPRALGNRSILASPVTPGVRDVINSRVKFREPFRPFAPSVLEERAAEWFEIDQADPFMTMAPRVRPAKAPLIPAAVHVDGTARIQTVSRAANPRYHALIERFAAQTGVPVLLNTSFNKQEPIVTRPEEAISCFLRTEMDVLVLGNFYTRDRPAGAAARARATFEVVEVNTRGGE
jgi:carbamoyltransferase